MTCMDIVNVIAWRRPDFLLATLTRLAAADMPNLHYRMNIDHDPDPDVVRVSHDFADKVGADRVEFIQRGPCEDQGPTRNMLMSLHESMEYGADLIHLAEDDVFPSVGYFEYHRSAHELAPDAFCVTACNPAPVAEWLTPENYPKAMLKPLAPTVGTSFKAARLEEILKYLPPSYLNDRTGHLRRTFPRHPCKPHRWNGIDGAMGRVLRHMNKLTVFPVVGRAYHAGFIGAGCEDRACNDNTTRDGYSNGPHRHGAGLTGTVEERAAQLLDMRAEDFNERADVGDHVWFDLDLAYGPVTEIIR
jgi:hypothetical protein